MVNDSLPWRRLMEIAYGALKLSPAAFWEMTPGEWMLAVNGWREAQGMGVMHWLPPVTHQALQEMMERFPDLIVTGDEIPEPLQNDHA